MKKGIFVALLAGLIFSIGAGRPGKVSAEVNIHVGINVPPPPPLTIHAPPPVVVVPRTYVYYAPDVSADIFFYGGYWYRPHEGHWYRAATYNGRWVYLAPKHVPVAVLHLPPDHRHQPPGHRHKYISHGDLKKNWRRWERGKHWEKHGGKEWHAEREHHERDGGKDRDHDRERNGDKGKGKHRS